MLEKKPLRFYLDAGKQRSFVYFEEKIDETIERYCGEEIRVCIDSLPRREVEDALVQAYKKAGWTISFGTGGYSEVGFQDFLYVK